MKNSSNILPDKVLESAKLECIRVNESMEGFFLIYGNNKDQALSMINEMPKTTAKSLAEILAGKNDFFNRLYLKDSTKLLRDKISVEEFVQINKFFEHVPFEEYGDELQEIINTYIIYK